MEITFLIILIIGYALGYIVGTVSPIINLKDKNHKPPKYYGYKIGTFSTITKCKNCDLTALYEDMHPINPCPRCGSKIIVIGAAKWDKSKSKWVRPEHFN
jgi:DNA-directed RNA polymerase subunit RPC12/RpoP